MAPVLKPGLRVTGHWVSVTDPVSDPRFCRFYMRFIVAFVERIRHHGICGILCILCIARRFVYSPDSSNLLQFIIMVEICRPMCTAETTDFCQKAFTASTSSSIQSTDTEWQRLGRVGSRVKGSISERRNSISSKRTSIALFCNNSAITLPQPEH